MALTINGNNPSASALRYLNDSQQAQSKSMRNLSSGKRINSAADDPAGLVIGEKMNAKLMGLGSAIRGNESTINMVRTADQSLGLMQDLLGRARQLAIDSSNTGVNDQSMQNSNQNQLNELLGAVDRLSGSAQFGTKNLLDGSTTVTAITNGDGATAEKAIAKTDTSTLGNGASYTNASGQATQVTDYSSLKDLAGPNGVLATGTADQKAQAIGVIDKAIADLGARRGELGAMESDFIGPATESFRVSFQELSAANSSIMDTDFAKETSNKTSADIKSQVALALQSQAKLNQQNLLKLLM